MKFYLLSHLTWLRDIGTYLDSATTAIQAIASGSRLPHFVENCLG